MLTWDIGAQVTRYLDDGTECTFTVCADCLIAIAIDNAEFWDGATLNELHAHVQAAHTRS